ATTSSPLSLHDALPIFPFPRKRSLTWAFFLPARGPIPFLRGGQRAVQPAGKTVRLHGGHAQDRQVRVVCAQVFFQGLFFHHDARSEEHTSELQSPCNIV